MEEYWEGRGNNGRILGRKGKEWKNIGKEGDRMEGYVEGREVL